MSSVSFNPNGILPAQSDNLFVPVALPANGNDIFNQLLNLPKKYRRVTLGAVGGASGLNTDLYLSYKPIPGTPDNITFASGAIAQLASNAPDVYPIYDNRCKRIISWEFCEPMPLVLFVSAANYGQGGGNFMLIFSNGIKHVDAITHV